MILNFEDIEPTALVNFYGGEGTLVAAMYKDENNKILKGQLDAGCNIGLHRHESSSEIIFILSGVGTVICDGETRQIGVGECHYCKRGSEHSLRNDGEEPLLFYAVVPEHQKDC